jgi:hypothetical protein
MAHTPNRSPLTDAQKREACLILSIGCDRDTVANYVGCSASDIRQAMLQDERFAGDVRRAEAGIELSHMRNIQNAAKDEKNWRVSVWWLERRAPERYARRNSSAVTTRQLENIVAWLVEAVMEEVQEPADRDRLVSRLERLAATLQQALLGSELAAAESSEQQASDSHAESTTELDDADGTDSPSLDDEYEL